MENKRVEYTSIIIRLYELCICGMRLNNHEIFNYPCKLGGQF